VLIERDAAELDVATDLSDQVYDGFGVTLVYAGRKPTVKIARELWEQRARNNRLRMTLAHEYGHYADIGITAIGTGIALLAVQLLNYLAP
jgi:hypothetical protein